MFTKEERELLEGVLTCWYGMATKQETTDFVTLQG